MVREDTDTAKRTRDKSGWARTKHPGAWGSWKSMRGRCTDEDNKEYFGKCCERWAEFDNFFAEMGDRPSDDHELDRRDPNGIYELENCRWITKEQNLATRINSKPTRKNLALQSELIEIEQANEREEIAESYGLPAFAVEQSRRSLSGFYEARQREAESRAFDMYVVAAIAYKEQIHELLAELAARDVQEPTKLEFFRTATKTLRVIAIVTVCFMVGGGIGVVLNSAFSGEPSISSVDDIWHRELLGAAEGIPPPPVRR